MNHAGPIILIEDDEDDREILQEIFIKLNYPNKILFFADAIQAHEFLINEDVSPFLIISDMNLPLMSGLELRALLRNHDKMNLRRVPYLFFTTSAGYKDVIDAYSDSVQGFFIKPSKISELENIVRRIVDYWKDSIEAIG